MPLHVDLSPMTRRHACARLTTTLSIAMIGAILCLLPAHAALADADSDHHVILSLESYVDDATDRSEVSIGALQNENEEAEVGRGPVVAAVSVAFMTKLAESLLVGGGLRYLGSYRYELDEGDEDEEEVLLGRLLEMYGRAEYLIGLDDDLHLVPAVELGLPMLFASGRLQAQLDELETTGYNVNSLPRMGFFLGGEVGVRFELEQWLALRGAFGVAHERLFLFDASTEDDTAETSRTMSLTRIRLSIGAEASF